MNLNKKELFNRVEQQVLKYAQKQDPKNIMLTLKNRRTAMVVNYARYAIVASRIYLLVRRICEANCIPSIYRRWYYTFALEVEKVCRLYPENEKWFELKNRREKWEKRGLDPDILVKIECRVRRLKSHPSSQK